MNGEKMQPGIEQVTGRCISRRSLGSGAADVWHLVCERGNFVLKENSSAPSGFFASEAQGLADLSQHGLRVPQVLLVRQDCLLMEYAEPGRDSSYDAGVQLAEMHRRGCEFYGASTANYLSSILQPNVVVHDWAEFYIEQRVNFCLEQIGALDKTERGRWQQFAERVRPLLESCHHPSWLHGDLWAGNLLMASTGACFIDPACYAGDALVDIAMTHLFGGFSGEFYRGYRQVMAERPGEEELLAIYQVYPLLIHCLLFDGAQAQGSAYYRSAALRRDRFL